MDLDLGKETEIFKITELSDYIVWSRVYDKEQEKILYDITTSYSRAKEFAEISDPQTMVIDLFRSFSKRLLDLAPHLRNHFCHDSKDGRIFIPPYKLPDHKKDRIFWESINSIGRDLGYIKRADLLDHAGKFDLAKPLRKKQAINSICKAKNFSNLLKPLFDEKTPIRPTIFPALMQVDKKSSEISTYLLFSVTYQRNSYVPILLNVICDDNEVLRFRIGCIVVRSPLRAGGGILLVKGRKGRWHQRSKRVQWRCPNATILGIELSYGIGPFEIDMVVYRRIPDPKVNIAATAPSNENNSPSHDSGDTTETYSESNDEEEIEDLRC